MATNTSSPIDKLADLPAWQLVLMWLVGAALIGLGWYFLYFIDAVEQRGQAQAGIDKANKDLAAAKQSFDDYSKKLEEQAERDRELKKKLEVVPLDAATIDHLIGTFQREARGVGLGIERWVPQAEQREEFYAKIPVEVTAIGTWHEIGEFFRRIAEMKQIVNVEGISMKLDREFETTGFPLLKIDFTASTFRLLSDKERAAGPDEGGTRRSGKRQGGA